MTLTTDELRQIVETDHVQCGDAAAMARELLANREAQPVAWSTVFGDKRAVTVHADTAEVWNSDGLQVQSLYTAPPAPAVPEEITEDEQEESVSDGYADSFRGGWNACRAAMLAAAPEYDILEDYRAEMLKRVTFGGDGKSSCNANSPEIPEGWKPVPVEPTKEMINAALAAGCASIRSTYREMLAAAPESGNEN